MNIKIDPRIRNILPKLEDGRIFAVVFEKRSTGERRKMLCRRGVVRVKGTGMSYDPTEKGLLVVWDLQKHGYRTIPLDRIESIKHHGEEVRL